MIKFEEVEVVGWRAAIRGMRNPKKSHDKSDSVYKPDFFFGPNDLKLAKTLHNAGAASHSKYKRYIVIYVDITAPLYWWKEFDTYKVGTVSDSESTMFKIADHEFTRDDFSCEHLTEQSLKVLDATIEELNKARTLYNYYNSKEIRDTVSKEFIKDLWWQLIQLLPSTFNQKRTIMLNYQVATAITIDREFHNQDEWREMVKFFRTLPYGNDIIIPNNRKKEED